MSCEWGQHVYQRTGYNPYDHLNTYECIHCGKYKSEKAPSVYTHTIRTNCCQSDWNGNQPQAPYQAGDAFECPDHGPTTVQSVSTQLVKGGPSSSGRTSSAEEPSVGCFVLMLVALLFIVVGCVAMLD